MMDVKDKRNKLRLFTDETSANSSSPAWVLRDNTAASRLTQWQTQSGKTWQRTVEIHDNW